MSAPSFYAIIPATVRYCKGLEGNAKLLYGEITALAQQEGYCWATNQYFATLYDVDVSTIKRWLSSLEENNFIKIETDKQGIQWKRKIWISPEIQKSFTKAQKCATPSSKMSHPQLKNEPHINTSITTEEKSVCNSGAESDRKKLKEADRKRILEETKGFSDLPTEVVKDHADGSKITVRLNDVFLASVRAKRDWKTSEIQEAWKAILAYAGPIREPFRFIEGTIDNFRKLKKAEYLNQRNSEPCILQTTQKLNDYNQKSSGQDTEELVCLGSLLEERARLRASNG